MTSAQVLGHASFNDIRCCWGDSGIWNPDSGDTGFYWVSSTGFKEAGFLEALGERKGLGGKGQNLSPPRGILPSPLCFVLVMRHQTLVPI